MSDPDRPESEAGPPAKPRTDYVAASDVGPVSPPTDVGIGGRFLEYVTFGYGVHHLLKVVLFQFAVLFLDVDLLAYTHGRGDPERVWFVTVTWVFASIVFLGVLAVLVRQIGRRTLAPRFHRARHLAVSVAGYLVASGVSFVFGYATFVLPNRQELAIGLPAFLPAWLLTVVFATFIAIGYHAQVAVTDHPSSQEITETVQGWLDALAWADAEPDSIATEEDYETFVTRSRDLQLVLDAARTAEGRQLAADFRTWYQRFETRSMLSRELVVEGREDDESPGSDRLAAEHETFVDIRERLLAIAELEAET